jgi:hypothetical protein
MVLLTCIYLLFKEKSKPEPGFELGSPALPIDIPITTFVRQFD